MRDAAAAAASKRLVLVPLWSWSPDPGCPRPGSAVRGERGGDQWLFVVAAMEEEQKVRQEHNSARLHPSRYCACQTPGGGGRVWGGKDAFDSWLRVSWWWWGPWTQRRVADEGPRDVQKSSRYYKIKNKKTSTQSFTSFESSYNVLKSSYKVLKVHTTFFKVTKHTHKVLQSNFSHLHKSINQCLLVITHLFHVGYATSVIYRKSHNLLLVLLTFIDVKHPQNSLQ